MRTGWWRVVVLDRDLRLRVGPQVVDLAALEVRAVHLHELVREPDRRGHQLRRLVAREAEHHPLVAGALLLVETLALRDALRDVLRLLAERDEHAAGLGVESHVRGRVSDVADDLADQVLVLDLGAGRDLSGEHDEAGLGERLAGDARTRILLEQRVEDRVRDLVAHLVRVTHRDRLGREQRAGSHSNSPRPASLGAHCKRGPRATQTRRANRLCNACAGWAAKC